MPSKKFKLWTIQRKEVMDEINKKGYYAPLARNTMAYRYSEEFKRAYDFISENLFKKDKNKGRNKYPVWAFLHRESPANYGVSEDGFIEMELEISENRLLLSDFSKYHCILNNGYCPINDDEYEEYHKKYYGALDSYKLLPEYTEEEHQQVIKDSWANIFDLSDSDKDDIQACFWKIEKDDIISVRDITEEEFRKEEDVNEI